MKTKFLVTFENEKLEKLLFYTKAREKSNLFINALEYFIKNENEEKLLEFSNKSFKSDFLKILREIKNIPEENIEEITNKKENTVNESNNSKPQNINDSLSSDEKDDREFF